MMRLGNSREFDSWSSRELQNLPWRIPGIPGNSEFSREFPRIPREFPDSE
jgi:hypothetical protein